MGTVRILGCEIDVETKVEPTEITYVISGKDKQEFFKKCAELSLSPIKSENGTFAIRDTTFDQLADGVVPFQAQEIQRELAKTIPDMDLQKA